jgi:capsular polysaccharide biosynthesis protein
MDLWDLTRLLFRRWYFAVPILLVSALVAVLVARSVEPDYRATGNAVLIPAPGDPGDAEARAQNKPINRPKNPWGDLGFNALGQAAILQVMRQETLAKFTSAGLSDSITVQMDVRSPIFIIEAIGKTPEQATGTVREVIKELSAEVAQQQSSYGVMPQDTITTRTLTDGSDVETVTSKVKRVLVVIVGLGVLLTMGGTIGIDVLLRFLRNRRRPDGENDGPARTDDEPETVTNPVIQPRFVATRGAGGSSEETQVIGRIPSTRAGAKGQVQLAKTAPGAAAPGLRSVGSAAGRASAQNSGRSSVRLENGGGRRSGDSDQTNGSNGKPQPAVSSAEATIILPIPRSQWTRGSDDRNGGR